MKIVIAVHHFPPDQIGGSELRAYRTAAWLHHQGHDVCIVCVQSIDSDKGFVFEDDVYDGLAVRRLSFDLHGAPDHFRWSYDNPWIGQHLQGYLDELEPDVLHLISGYLMSGSTIRAARSLNIPTVVTLTDFWFLCPRITMLRSDGQLCRLPLDAVRCAQCLGEERRLYRIPGRIAPRLMSAFWNRRSGRIAQIQARSNFLREVLSCVDVIISPSRFLRAFFIEAGMSAEQIVFSRQGQIFSDSTPEVSKKFPAPHLRLGYMGKIAPHKGVHILFRAARKLPSASLRVKAYGDLTSFPNYARQLQQMARQDSRLNLAGVYERAELGRVLQELDAVVVPSVWRENSPNVILEAFGHRTPVITSDLGGMTELVHHEENGLLFAPGDIDGLAKQLRRLLEDPQLLPALRAGIGPVKSMAQEMKELVEFYQGAAGNGYLRPTGSPLTRLSGPMLGIQSATRRNLR